MAKLRVLAAVVFQNHSLRLLAAVIQQDHSLSLMLQAQHPVLQLFSKVAAAAATSEQHQQHHRKKGHPKGTKLLAEEEGTRELHPSSTDEGVRRVASEESRIKRTSRRRRGRREGAGMVIWSRGMQSSCHL